GNLNQDQKLGGRTLAGISLFVGLVFAVFAASAQPLTTSRNTNQIRIVELQGTVEISPAGATTWVLTQTNRSFTPTTACAPAPTAASPFVGPMKASCPLA